MILEKLRPYQAEAVDKLVSHRRQLLADQPGLGKTYMALAACEKDGLLERKSRILVLARTTGAVITWLPKVRELLHDTPVTIVNAVEKTRAHRDKAIRESLTSDQCVIVITNHNGIEVTPANKPAIPAMFETSWDAVIIDESQWVLPTEATKLPEMTQFWRGLAQLRIPPEALRIASSGTPDRSGRLEQRYGTYKFLLPERYNGSYDYDMWVYENFHLTYYRVPVVGKTGNRFYLEQRRAEGLKRPGMWSETESLLMIRRTKEEVLPDLPPKQYEDIYLPHPAKLKRAYKEFQARFEAIDDGSAIAADVFGTRARQFATCEWNVTQNADGSTTATPIIGGESEKLAWILEWLAERGFTYEAPATASKVVIASQYSEVLRWLQAELRLRQVHAEILDGSLSTSARLRLQQAFQTDDGTRIVLLNMSLGDSIDLDAADDLIFVDLVHSPDRTEQVEDRIHRASRNHQVTIWRLRSIDTMDIVIANENNSRYEESRALMDGARGVEFARRIIERIKE